MNLFSPGHFFDTDTFSHKALFSDVGFVWELFARFDHFFKDQKLDIIEGGIHAGAYLVNPDQITIGKGSIVEPGAYVQGPCVIGSDCVIRHGAYIRGGVITGDRVVIGHATEVKNTLFLDDAKAAHFAYIGDSIIGNRVNLGAGTRCANLKLSNDEITVSCEGNKQNTGRRKLGAIIGDDTQVGCNAVLNPGTLLAKHVTVFPALSFSGYAPERSKVINPVKPIVEVTK